MIKNNVHLRFKLISPKFDQKKGIRNVGFTKQMGILRSLFKSKREILTSFPVHPD